MCDSGGWGCECRERWIGGARRGRVWVADPAIFRWSVDVVFWDLWGPGKGLSGWGTDTQYSWLKRARSILLCSKSSLIHSKSPQAPLILDMYIITFHHISLLSKCINSLLVIKLTITSLTYCKLIRCHLWHVSCCILKELMHPLCL